MDRFLVKVPPKIIRISADEAPPMVHSKTGMQTFNAKRYELPEPVAPHSSSFTTERSSERGLDLPAELTERMYDHQREGVQWMYELRHLPYKGGILGDDMGLGKTFQTVSLLAGLIRAQLGSKFIIIAPVAVLPTWIREIETHAQPYCKRLSVILINAETTKSRRIQILKQVCE
jgi:SNF2 family DNA or RNA helicase